MRLQEMSDKELYELYDALDSLKTLDSEVAHIIYADLMRKHRACVIDALQLSIVEAVIQWRC